MITDNYKDIGRDKLKKYSNKAWGKLSSLKLFSFMRRWLDFEMKSNKIKLFFMIITNLVSAENLDLSQPWNQTIVIFF